MNTERRITVEHTTGFRWIQHYAPPINKRVYWEQRYTGAAWLVDETDVKGGAIGRISPAPLISCCRRAGRRNQRGVCLASR